jgi:membrane-associated protease RseP (regulator of RpoE activity)
MTQIETPPAASAPEPQPRREWSPEEQRQAFIRLIVIVAAGVLAAVATGVTKTVLVVFALILMIMLHELGHFMTAKWAGMKVTEYFLGFGPRLWSVRKGETEYGIKAIPAGGYVKIVGMSSLEEVPPEDEPRTYRQKSYWRRLSVAVAGSTVHFILALILLWTLFTVTGVPNYDKPLPVVNELVGLETGPSPAQDAGFKLGDRIVSVDGRAVGDDWDTLPTYIRARPGEPIDFVVRRAGRELTLTATPVDLSKVKVKGGTVAKEPTGFIGIGPKIPVEKKGVLEGAGKAVTGLGKFTTATVGAIVRIFSPSGVSNYAAELSGRSRPGDDASGNRFISPVGFVRIAGQAAESGWRDVLILLAGINVFVGVFNMIPLLPFDGGHVAIATYEAVRSRKGRRYYVDGRKALAAAYPVVFLLILIAVTSLYIDVVRPLGNPYR